jgi:hypothetical protein
MILLNFSQKRGISRAKNDIINIYLAYKKIFAHFSSEECGIRLTNPKIIFNKKIPKTFIPCPWSLF